MHYKLKQIINDISRIELIDEKSINVQLANWINERGETDSSISDFIWSTLNKLINDYAQSGVGLVKIYKYNQKAYLIMFMLLRYEKKNVSGITELINKCELGLMELMEYETDVIVIPPNDCSYGSKFKGKIFDYSEAINNFPVNYSKCKREGGCICKVGSEAKRNKEGRLIFKDN
ncbi:hypothetical protein MD537_14790 [Flavihumibacter sediminis]|nr:hypothetical protein [Flavihumibacter sediminis]